MKNHFLRFFRITRAPKKIFKKIKKNIGTNLKSQEIFFWNISENIGDYIYKNRQSSFFFKLQTSASYTYMVSVAPASACLLTSVPLHHHGSFFKDAATSYENHELRACTVLLFKFQVGYFLNVRQDILYWYALYQFLIQSSSSASSSSILMPSLIWIGPIL